MSDVVAAALIAGLVGLLGSVATIIVTRMNVADQTQQRRIDRHHEVHESRKTPYAEMAWHLNRLHKYSTVGFPPGLDDWVDWLDHYDYTSGVVQIIGTPGVIEAVEAYDAALGEAASDLRAAVDGAAGITWMDAYRPHADGLERARQGLLSAMRTDAQTDP
jgi:hypothetical protein